MSDLARIHPRLLRSEAERRLIELAALPLTALRELATVSDAGAVYAATGAARTTAAELTQLQRSLRDVADTYGYPELPSRRAAIAFDRDLAELLLRGAALFPAEAAAPEVWSFHALALAPDVVLWRWRDGAGKINRERAVGSDLTRHAFGRMWWRGYLLCAQPDGHVDLDGLERLEVFGEADFDHIQARRRAYGGSPRVLQQLTSLWLRRVDDIRAHDSSEREILRDLLKRLLRLGAFLRFDLLADDDLAAELDRALDDTLDGLAARPAVEDKKATVDARLNTPSARHFDDVPLGQFVLLITQLLEQHGPTRGRELASSLESHTGIEVPASRERWVTRLAWVAKGFGYVARDDEDTWSPGDVTAAPDPRWAAWTVTQLRERASELTRQSDSPFEALLSEAYAGGKPSKLARTIVHTVVDEVEAALVG